MSDQRLTDAELAAIEQRYDNAHEDMQSYSAETLRLQNTARDVPRLLAEVDRIRAENARLRKQVQDYHESATAHVAKFERQHERLMEAEERIAAARKALFDDAFEGHAQRYRALAKVLGNHDE